MTLSPNRQHVKIFLFITTGNKKPSVDRWFAQKLAQKRQYYIQRAGCEISRVCYKTQSVYI